MPTFPIDTESVLGISHSGEVTAEGEGTVELTDEEVQQLIDLIRENGGETDVEKLELEEKYPEIYSKLDEAYREVARHAEYIHWVNEGYDNGWYDLSVDESSERCEEFGFHFEYNPDDFCDEDGEIDEDALEEAKSDALDEWVDEYRGQLNDYEAALFLAEVFDLEPNDAVFDYEYSVDIPQEIINMANADQER